MLGKIRGHRDGGGLTTKAKSSPSSTRFAFSGSRDGAQLNCCSLVDELMDFR
jgi:hypothetical protein